MILLTQTSQPNSWPSKIDMKLRQKYFVLVGIAVLLSFHVISNVKYAQADVILLPEEEVIALLDMFANWNKSTEDFNSSLPGWQWYNASDPTQDPCFFHSWRGVFCFITVNETYNNIKYWEAHVVSVAVNDASIVGTLPSTIWDFTKLVSLTLTGNPGLTGPIPPPPVDTSTTGSLWSLKSLDLHGNGFNGSIPEQLFEWCDYVEDLDLSSNRLEGPLPLSLGADATRLRNLNLSNNSLIGPIQSNIAMYWNSLVTADFSSTSSPWPVYSISPPQYLFIHCPLPNLSSWITLQILKLSGNNFDGQELPFWLSNLTSLETLSLSDTSLTGEFNPSMFNSFTQLKILELDDNYINGTLDVDRLLNIPGLRSVSLKYNNISNVIFSYNVTALKNITIDLYKNPYCDGENTDTRRCLCEQVCFITPRPRSTQAIIIGATVGGSLGAVMMIIAAMLYWKNKRDTKYLLLTVHEKFAEYELKPTLFAYSELQKATRDFHPDLKLGEGGFGTVYKGTLADRTVVAIKQLLPKAQQNMDDFLNEVILLTSVKHRNLVKLKGCCLHGDRRLLVYEYVDNYDLAETLFEHKGDQLVTWPARFNICLGVAHGLHYLHAGVHPRIIHRDIKASNILLDSNLQPKIADFGLAMLYPDEDTHITIVQIAGTKHGNYKILEA